MELKGFLNQKLGVFGQNLKYFFNFILDLWHDFKNSELILLQHILFFGAPIIGLISTESNINTSLMSAMNATLMITLAFLLIFTLRIPTLWRQDRRILHWYNYNIILPTIFIFIPPLIIVEITYYLPGSKDIYDIFKIILSIYSSMLVFLITLLIMVKVDIEQLLEEITSDNDGYYKAMASILIIMFVFGILLYAIPSYLDTLDSKQEDISIRVFLFYIVLVLHGIISMWIPELKQNMLAAANADSYNKEGVYD